MLRLLLATTALSAVLVTGVLSQDASSSSAMDTASSSSMATDTSSSAAATDASSAPSSAMDSSMMSSQMSDASSMDSEMMSSASNAPTITPRTPVEILSGYTRVDTDRLASKIIGQPVYDGTGTDANNLGNIKDLVLDQNGQVAAVVVGVGGFLGIGEKQVAVDFTALQFVVAADNTERYVVQTTKDELTNAPDFQTVDDNPANPSGAPGASLSSAPVGATSSSTIQ